MINLSSFLERKVGVFGLGRSGLSCALALKKGGAEVFAWDDNEIARKHATTTGLELVDLYKVDWSSIDSLVLSPGIRLNYPKPHSIVQIAHESNVEIIGDLELLARSELNAPVIGITGTNGKSTTTALVGHILTNANHNVEVGGNLGVPVLNLDNGIEVSRYVIEVSSFQLELIKSLVFDIAVLLNLSGDHLERHGGMRGYIEAKKRIFGPEGSQQIIIVCIDDANSMAIFEELKGSDRQVVGVSIKDKVDSGVYIKSDTLFDNFTGRIQTVKDFANISNLPGSHNLQNVAVAYTIARACGLEIKEIIDGISSFSGLAHRQEKLAVIDGIQYINDSKATNGQAAARALGCYRNIYWIVGGRAKEDGVNAAFPHLSRVRHAYLIGEAATEFASKLERKVPVTIAGQLSSAVHKARENALAELGDGATVLFSPACSSFDQFQNFESRGDAFRKIIESLPGAREEAMA